jgi:GntR family transcriptional repressor for pyruvate dehydrogenase complex
MAKNNTVATFRIAPLKRQRVSETVAEQLRKAIFTGRIQSGHKLPPERDMALQFDTSRVALREALRALEQEGMIRIKRGSGGGAFVADFNGALRALAGSLNTVVKLGQAKSVHLTEVRTMLEPEMARIASLRADEADLKAIEEVVQAQEDELRSGSLSRKYDMEFHRLVANACHNPVLPIVVVAIDESIRDSILRSKLTHEMRAGVVAYHRRILDAIRSRDGDLAYSIMKEHVVAVQTHLRESEEPQPNAEAEKA